MKIWGIKVDKFYGPNGPIRKALDFLKDEPMPIRLMGADYPSLRQRVESLGGKVILNDLPIPETKIMRLKLPEGFVENLLPYVSDEYCAECATEFKTDTIVTPCPECQTPVWSCNCCMHSDAGQHPCAGCEKAGNHVAEGLDVTDESAQALRMLRRIASKCAAGYPPEQVHYDRCSRRVLTAAGYATSSGKSMWTLCLSCDRGKKILNNRNADVAEDANKERLY